MEIIPKKGIKGLIENWQSDLLAAVSVSLVALPLALGIAIASGVPPISGILSAIIGGVVTTFFRGSQISINGPAAGLIAVIISSGIALNDGTGQSLNYVFAAIVISGLIQIILGVLKLGRFAEIFPSSVIHGILAAIGIIIITKELPLALGIDIHPANVIDTLIMVFQNLALINPFVAIISVLGLLILIFHSKLSYKVFHFLPAPIWVLALSIPFVFAFNFFEGHHIAFLENSYYVGPEFLIEIPENLKDFILFPNFSKIGTSTFWLCVISITLIASVQTLAVTKAVDKLDPYKRKTDLNKDLIGVGISTMTSGFLGGLPIITVIVRSTVNIHNNAKTKWSNLYHGILLFIFVFLLTPIIQMIPLSSLAVILVYTGFKLTSPNVFKYIYSYGVEQLIFFIVTIIITLYTDLLIGIFGGMLITLLSHLMLSKMSLSNFMKDILNSNSNIFVKKDGTFNLELKGIVNFLSIINFNKLIDQIPKDSEVNIQLSDARLIDHTIMDTIHEFKRIHEFNGGKVTLLGLDKHVSSSNHHLSLKLLNDPSKQLSNRQIRLKNIAREYSWTYEAESKEKIKLLQSFYFFKTRTIIEKSNCLTGSNNKISWEIADITFDEGAFMSSEIYSTSIGIIDLPFEIPKFTIEKKGVLDKYFLASRFKDIDYRVCEGIMDDFILKVENKKTITSFLNDQIKELIINGNINHLESNGTSILIFNNDLKVAQFNESTKMIHFINNIVPILTPPTN